MYTPLEQFKINSILRIYNNYIDLTITNSTIYMMISILGIILIIYGTHKTNNKIISNSYIKNFFEILYIKTEEIIKDILGTKYNKYIPFIYSLFLFILINNVIGLIPYSFTTTSHIIVTLTMSLTIMIGLTLLGLYKHSYKFFTLFIPNGLNKGFTKYLIPLIFLIELISYLSRIISLSVRLAANLMSGHTLLKIIANTSITALTSIKSYFLTTIVIVLPILLLCALFILETGVSIIQAYVFTLLTLTYIKDVELLH